MLHLEEKDDNAGGCTVVTFFEAWLLHCVGLFLPCAILPSALMCCLLTRLDPTSDFSTLQRCAVRMCVLATILMLLWWLGLQDAGGGYTGMGGHADTDLNAWQQRQVQGTPCTASTGPISGCYMA